MQLDYGNWVRKKNLLILGLCALGMGALIFIPLGLAYQIVATILFIIIFVSFLFPLYAYTMFSQKGGKLQEKNLQPCHSAFGKRLEWQID